MYRTFAEVVTDLPQAHTKLTSKGENKIILTGNIVCCIGVPPRSVGEKRLDAPQTICFFDRSSIAGYIADGPTYSTLAGRWYRCKRELVG